MRMLPSASLRGTQSTRSPPLAVGTGVFPPQSEHSRGRQDPRQDPSQGEARCSQRCLVRAGSELTGWIHRRPNAARRGLSVPPPAFTPPTLLQPLPPCACPRAPTRVHRRRGASSIMEKLRVMLGTSSKIRPIAATTESHSVDGV